MRCVEAAAEAGFEVFALLDLDMFDDLDPVRGVAFSFDSDYARIAHKVAERAANWFA